MQQEREETDGGTATPAQSPSGVEAPVCPSCRAAMFPGMRFCRLCGYRLGEGLEEYAETRRFSGVVPPVATHATASRPTSAPSLNMPGEWGAVAPVSNTTALDSRTTTSSLARIGEFCHPKRANWLVWVIIAFVIMSVGGVMNQGWREGRRDGRSIASSQNVSRSYLGADTADADNGALLESVMPPGSPADVAGLVGGDVITAFDGDLITDEDDLLSKLSETPIGKTVEIEYLRDGEARKTMFATISKGERDRLSEQFASRPEGDGFLGINPGGLEQVSEPERKFYGVRLGDVLRNRPGYIAGLRDGDVVMEFGGVPIRTKKELLARINRALPDSVVNMTVMRGNQRLELPVKMGKD